MKSEQVLSVALEMPERITDIPEIHQENDKVAWLQDNVDVQRIRDSEYLAVSLTNDFTHQQLKDIVNAVTRAYIAEGVEKDNRKMILQKTDLEEPPGNSKAGSRISTRNTKNSPNNLGRVRQMNRRSSRTCSWRKCN